MKKYTFLILSVICTAALFSGCGYERDPEEYIVSDALSIVTAVPYREYIMVDAPVETTTVAEPTALKYTTKGAEVELLMNDKLVKKLEFYYTPDVSAISVADFNCDGYQDIFIPYCEQKSYGYYYCYDPEKNDFVENEQLASVGRIMTVADGVLTEDRSDDMTKRTIEYQWVGDKLLPTHMTEIYTLDETGETQTYTYTFDENGTPIIDTDD